MKTNALEMTNLYSTQLTEVEHSLADLEANYPAELNKDNEEKLYDLKAYCKNRILQDVSLEYHIVCQKSKYSLTDICNYIALAPSKLTELEVIVGSFIKETPPPPSPNQPKKPKKLKLTIAKKVMKVGEYKKILTAQLQAMSGLGEDDEVDVTLNN